MIIALYLMVFVANRISGVKSRSLLLAGINRACLFGLKNSSSRVLIYEEFLYVKINILCW